MYVQSKMFATLSHYPLEILPCHLPTVICKEVGTGTPETYSHYVTSQAHLYLIGTLFDR